MEFLGIFSSALLLSSLLLIILNIYCIHAYYKLTDKINQIYFVINSVLKDPNQNNVMSDGENKKEINILPENFKHFYYPTSSSSLIEVSSDDNTTSSYETYSDDEQEDINFNDCKIKNVRMSLDLDNLEDIHVLLLDEISNIEIQTQEQMTTSTMLELVEEPTTTEEVIKVVEELTTAEEVIKVVDEENNNLILTTSEPKELNFKPKKRESRKNMGCGDYKKMNLTDLRKYIIENNINIDTSKMKKPEILKAMEELKKNESKEIVDESKEILNNECEEIVNNELKEILNDENINEYLVG
jgi:hypothetical protein